jgi:outer membrane protein TolC
MMKNRLNWIAGGATIRPSFLPSALLTALLVAASTFVPALAQQNKPTWTIAVVQDGSGPESALVDRVEAELPEHLARGTSVSFRRDAAFDAGWDPNQVSVVLQRALDDPGIDLVLAVGSLVTNNAARRDVRLAKPVVSTFVQRSDIFPLPYLEEDRSLKENLSFIAIPQRAGRDVTTFQEMLGFRALHVFVSAEDLGNIEELRAGLQERASELGITVDIVPVVPDTAETLSRLGSEVEAVYLTRLQRLSEGQRRELIAQLNDRKIPTFSLLGHPDVERGVLGGLTPDIEEQVVRRVAINLSRLVDGAPVADLPVLLSVDTRLQINAETARKVGYRPDVATRLFADFLHPEALTEGAEKMAFGEALEMAEAGNTALTVKDAEVESVRQDQNRARSVLYPQLFLDLNYFKTDGTMVNPNFPQGPANATTGTLTLRQLIYDDDAWSTYKASGEDSEGAQWEREARRLDVLFDAGFAYLQLGLAEALRRIEIDNLHLSEDNLELARLRREVGYSGRDEILRWEAIVAEGRSAVFRSEEDVEVARIALNQILGVEQYQRWTIEEIDIDPDVFALIDPRLDPVLDDYLARPRLRDVLVELALENDPELMAIETTLAAQEIRLSELKRRYYLPTFFADLSYSDRFSRSGNTFLIPEDDFYTIFVGATYPIYEGGRKRHDVARATSDYDGILRQRQLAEQLVERRTRIAMRRSENSFPRIKFSRQSSAAARQNLDLVTDQYAEGIVNVTDLLDAQNQSFASEQLTAAATYQFLIDIVELQRALSWFLEDKSREERDRFVERVRTAVAARPADPEDTTR